MTTNYAEACLFCEGGGCMICSHKRIKELGAEIERFNAVASCGTADGFMALSDDDKRKWFVSSLRESTERKKAQQRMASLEAELKEKMEELNCQDAKIDALEVEVKHFEEESDENDTLAREWQQIAFDLRKHQQWIPVDGAENAPIGDWLFLMEDGTQHTGNVHENVTIIANYFIFDMPKAIAYMPLPTSPTDKGKT